MAAWAVFQGSISKDVLVLLAVLVPSVILHEVSHGVAALAFGDDTAKRAGRLTLNPIKHVDPFGTIILPAIMLISTGGRSAFGFAKPVPVNPRRMRDPRNHGLLVSLAGPGTNIAIALASGLTARYVLSTADIERAVTFPDHAPLLHVALVNLGLLNVFLAVFNLIPIPPLDGSAVIERIIPASLWPRYLRLRQYSMPLIFVLVLFGARILTPVFDWATREWALLLR